MEFEVLWVLKHLPEILLDVSLDNGPIGRCHLCVVMLVEHFPVLPSPFVVSGCWDPIHLQPRERRRSVLEDDFQEGGQTCHPS